jgi:hypothetical protein
MVFPMGEKGWRMILLILGILGALGGIAIIFNIVMTFINNPTDWLGLVILASLIIYSIFLVIMTGFLMRKKSLSEKIQINNSKIDLPISKETPTQKDQLHIEPKIESSPPKEVLSEKNRLNNDFKKDRLPIFQDRINRILIPQLKNKVIERSKSSEFSNQDDFFRRWLEGSEKQFSTARILTSNLESDKIFDGDSYHIRNKFEKADEKLFEKVDNLYKELKKYDALMTHLLEQIAETYQQRFGDGKWENIAELHFYKLFNVEEIKRRKGHKANNKDLSKGKILKSELEKQKKEIEKKAYELILESISVVFWEKKIPYDVKSNIRRITNELNKHSLFDITIDSIYRKYQLKD